MHTVFCYIYPDMADFEVVLLIHRLHNAGGRRIVTIAETLDPVYSQSGLRYLPDKTIDQVSAEEAEALIIPGGPIDNAQNAILSLLCQMHAQNKLIAAICFGPQFLARAGILDAHQYTTSCTPQHIADQKVKDPFPRQNFVDQRVVRDGNVVTAQGHAFVDFAVEVCRALQIYRDAQQEYDELGKIKEN